MSKFLIIPDVHGRTFWRYALDHVDEYDKVIFLGDYLDPYPNEGISFDFAVNNFKDILEFKDNYYNKVELLLGNHDMHYVDTGFMDCSRLNHKRRNEMNELYSAHRDCFKLIYIHDKCLFSHAGVYDEWLDRYNLTIGEIQSADFLDEHQSSLESISNLRGGWYAVGSCIWADIRESARHGVNTDYYQIVGHTQLADEPYVTRVIACLDVRRCFELDTNTKQITEVTDELNIIDGNSSN